VDHDRVHRRGHASIEQLHAELKNSAFATCHRRGSPQTLPGSSWPSSAQPDAGHRERLRPITGQGDHRHHRPQTDHRPRPDRVRGQPTETAPHNRLALARCVARVVHPDLRTTPNRDSLNSAGNGIAKDTKDNTPTARPGRHPRPPTRPVTESPDPPLTRVNPWIEADMECPVVKGAHWISSDPCRARLMWWVTRGGQDGPVSVSLSTRGQG
jgi:hypothetical protein